MGEGGHKILYVTSLAFPYHSLIIFCLFLKYKIGFLSLIIEKRSILSCSPIPLCLLKWVRAEKKLDPWKRRASTTPGIPKWQAIPEPRLSALPSVLPHCILKEGFFLEICLHLLQSALYSHSKLSPLESMLPFQFPTSTMNPPIISHFVVLITLWRGFLEIQLCEISFNASRPQIYALRLTL